MAPTASKAAYAPRVNALEKKERRRERAASVALRSAVRTPRARAAATSAGHTSSFENASTLGESASSTTRASPRESKGRYSAKSTESDLAKPSALGEKKV